jgi:hypothetical protein
MRFLRRTAAGLLVTGVLACGGKAVIDGASGGGGAGAAGQGASGAGASGQGASGAGASGPGQGGGGGVKPTGCAELELEYQKALLEAKRCNANLSVRQCTVFTGSDLTCNCPTSVNPQNQDALAAMDKIRIEWQADGCGIGGGTCKCVDPAGAVCQPNGMDGDLCTDFL